MEEIAKAALTADLALKPSSVVPVASPSSRIPKALRFLKVATDWRLVGWNLLEVALSPILIGMKLRRYHIKRTNHEFNLRRFFVPRIHSPESVPQGSGPHVVLVGASFGEAILMQRITRALLEERPDIRITWAIRDPRTIEEFRRHQPNQALAIWPFDSMIPVLRWLWLYEPDLIVFTERYSFPHLVAGSKRWGAKSALLNGRVKSTGFPRSISSYYKWLFGCFDSLSFQSEAYSARVHGLVSKDARISVTGNIKLDLARKELDERRADEVDRWLAPKDGLPLLAAGSTNNKEEERFVLEAFRRVRSNIPCRLLLAPRKFERVAEPIRIAQDFGLGVSLRSRLEPPADVMVLDTLGELAHAYQFCVAAYVGGAYNGMGHNVAEPVEWGVPVSYGMRRGHFEDLQRMCERAGVGFRVSDEAALAEHWTRVLTDSELLEGVRTTALKMFASERGAVERTARALVPVIELL